MLPHAAFYHLSLMIQRPNKPRAVFDSPSQTSAFSAELLQLKAPVKVPKTARVSKSSQIHPAFVRECETRHGSIGDSGSEALEEQFSDGRRCLFAAGSVWCRNFCCSSSGSALTLSLLSLSSFAFSQYTSELFSRFFRHLSNYISSLLVVYEN